MGRISSLSSWDVSELSSPSPGSPQSPSQHLVPKGARKSNQSILKEISPENSLEGLMLKLKHQYFGHLMGRADSLDNFHSFHNILQMRCLLNSATVHSSCLSPTSSPQCGLGSMLRAPTSSPVFLEEALLTPYSC